MVTVASQMHRAREEGAARRPARPAAALPALGSPTPRRSWPTCCSPSSSTAGSRRAGLPVTALAAHPGYAGTHLVVNGRFGRPSGGVASILDAVNRKVSQTPAAGAWPILMAATADLPGSTYCGPSGPAEASGPPTVVGCTRLARHAETGRRLWELSESATGIELPLRSAGAAWRVTTLPTPVCCGHRGDVRSRPRCGPSCRPSRAAPACWSPASWWPWSGPTSATATSRSGRRPSASGSVTTSSTAI